MPDQPVPPVHRGFDLTFRTRILLSMCILVILTGAVVILVSHRGNLATTQLLALSLFRQVSANAADQTHDFVQSAAPVAESLQILAKQKTLDLDNLDHLSLQILAFLKSTPGMTSIRYADQSGDYISAHRLRDGKFHINRIKIAGSKNSMLEYEVQPDDSLKLIAQDDNNDYDPRTRPYYTLGLKNEKIAWTPPYMFFTQNLTGVSCVAPVRLPSGQTRGVFSVEFDRNALTRFVTNLSLSTNSRIFLFTTDQLLLAHPNQDTIAGRGTKGRAPMLTLAGTGDPLINAFRQNLQPDHLTTTSDPEESEETRDSKGFHFFQFTHGGVSYMASTRIFPIGDGQPWVVGAIAPQSDFLAPIWRTRKLALTACACTLLIAALFAAFTARRISQPIHALIAFMNKVGAGDLDARADLRGGREFRDLSVALNQMIADLRERLLLRTSLRVAMDVQQSLLPAADPVSPLLDVAGKSNYCDQTGGDYYDYMEVIDVTTVSKTQLLIAVADVMGHGLPAALLMATARAAIRTCVQDEHALAQIMTRTNQILATNNRQTRFVTLSLLIIDAPTRTVRWASAGHDPAIVFDPATDTFSELDGGDIPLGLMEDTKYEEYTSPPMPPNSVLLMGTDGIWEMLSEDNQQYGKTRLQSVMRDNHTKTAAQIGAALEADLKSFRGKAIPNDDVTFVVVKFLPPARTADILPTPIGSTPDME